MAKNINDLPEELLAEIFSYLPAVGLCHARGTSKGWNELILTCRKTKNKLTMFVDRKTIEEMKTIPEKVSGITFDEVELVEPRLMKFVKGNSATVQRLTFRDVLGGEIQPILKHLPLLEHLEIVEAVKYSSPEPIVLENLKCLKINERCVNILEKIKITKNITEFSILDLKMDGKFATVAKFLRRCPALKKLSVCIKQELRPVLSEMFNPTGLSADVPFRLKSLCMGGFVPYANEVTVSKFLELHEQTLEHLDIQGQRFLMHEELWRQVFTRFPKLKSLKVHGKSVPDESSFYLCIEPLHSVVDLTIKSSLSKHQSAKTFYALFPSLERLTVDPELRFFPKLFTTLSKCHPNLQYLSYSSFQPGTPINLHYKNLKHLAVHDVRHKNSFMNFVLSHRDLVSIKIGTVDGVTNAEMSDILELPALMTLELIANKQSEIKRIYNLIKQDYKRLQSVKFSYKVDPGKDLQLHQEVNFPLEKKFWNPQKYEKFFST